jgi:vitamin B12 transporter
MNCKWFMAVCILFVSVLAAGRVSAMGTPEDQGEDIFSLGEIVVPAKSDGIEAAETVHVITADDIRRSSARTLDEAINLLSDVNVQVGVDGTPRVDIRGFKTRHVLLLLDGIPMNSSFDQQFDPSMIPVDNIAKIKVTVGASSVLYGQGGLGGVINIITKKGGKGLKGVMGFESGDGQPYYTRASLSGGRGKIDFFASGSVFRRDKFPLAKDFTASVYEANGYRKNSDLTRDNAYFNLGYTPNDNLYIALTGNWVQGGYGKPASAINNAFDPYAPKAKFGRVDWYGGYSLQLAADYTPSPELNVRSSIYYNRIDQDNNQYDDDNYGNMIEMVDGNYVIRPETGGIIGTNPTVPNSYLLRNRGITRGASIQPRYDMGKFGTVTLGFSGEWDTWTDSGLVKTGGNGGTGGGSAGGHGVGGGSPPYDFFPVSDHYDLFISSAGIEYSVSPLKDLGFAIGYAHNWQFRDETDTDDYSVSVSTYYDLFRGTRLKAAFQRNVRFPSLSQLYLRDSNNPDLANEKVFHYELGVRQNLPWRTVFDIQGFRSDLYNVIVLDQSLTPPKNMNFSLYRFYGFDSTLSTNFLPALTLKAGYTMNISQDLSGVGRDEVQYVPKNKFTFTGSYDFDFGLTPFVSVVYVGESYVYSKQVIPLVLKEQMANYTVVNLKFSQKLYKKKLSVYVGADNLFNKNYEQSYGIPRPGRFIFGGIEYNFNI